MEHRRFSVIDLAWAAGFLEGEGTFGWYGVQRMKYGRVSAAQVQREPLERLAKLFGGTIRVKCEAGVGRQRCHIWQVSGRTAIGVMMTLYAFMSPRRSERIREVLTAWRQAPKARAYRQKCDYGHPLLDSYFHSNGKRRVRVCRECKQATNARWLQAQKGGSHAADA